MPPESKVTGTKPGDPSAGVWEGPKGIPSLIGWLEHLSVAASAAPADEVLLAAWKRFFARRTGVTFRDHALRLRMSTAAALLRDHDESVKSVAGSLGYANQSNFAREFRRALGISPVEFREQLFQRQPGCPAPTAAPSP
jgi:hypothetical protein